MFRLFFIIIFYMKDYYKILEITKDTDSTAIKKSYKISTNIILIKILIIKKKQKKNLNSYLKRMLV